MCCCKTGEEGATRERNGAKCWHHKGSACRRRKRARRDGRGEQSETPVRARAGQVRTKRISRRTITKRSSYLFNLTHEPHLSAAAVHAGLFGRPPPPPLPPPPPNNCHSHFDAEFGGDRESREHRRAPGLEPKPHDPPWALLTNTDGAVRNPAGGTRTCTFGMTKSSF